MAWSRQTPTAKARRLHPEITAVLLNQHISSNFRRAKQTVHRRVNRHRLVDAVEAVRVAVRDDPPSIPFDERQTIGRVAVDLVRTREDERRIGAMLPRHLE